ncbi:hypothetical protein F5B18DRAFT_657658 [Nemania serpens]|nr:hypothetical protein F5B18DRAFT_657658 [Nemania serpens]
MNGISILQHLYDNGCALYLNQQDKWGWIPLHYRVFAESRANCYNKLPKLRFLLEKGANTETRASHPHLRPIPSLGNSTPIELADYLEQRHATGAGTMLRASAHAEEKFYDAAAFPHEVFV